MDHYMSRVEGWVGLWEVGMRDDFPPFASWGWTFSSEHFDNLHVVGGELWAGLGLSGSRTGMWVGNK